MSKRMSNDIEVGEGVEQTGVLAELTLNDVVVNEDKNLRRVGWADADDKEIVKLAEDINHRGQLSAVVVMRNGEPGKYQLVAGFRRMAAIRIAVETLDYDKPVLARIVETDDEKSALLDNLAENVKRKDLSPMNMAFAAKDLSNFGMSLKEIAKEFGRHESWLRQVLTFLTFPEHIQRKIHTGEVPFTVARKLYGLEPPEMEKVLLDVKAAMEGGESAKGAAERASQKAKGGKSSRGRNTSENKAEGGAKKGMSAKKAVMELKAAIAEVKEQEKVQKKEETAVELYKLTVKLLTGGTGIQGFHKNVLALL